MREKEREGKRNGMISILLRNIEVADQGAARRHGLCCLWKHGWARMF